jgi:hypothetical protein
LREREARVLFLFLAKRGDEAKIANNEREEHDDDDDDDC